jgi:hypothetical protein
LQRRTERVDHIPEQVVGQRAGRGDALLLERDRGGLNGADPDRQVPGSIYFLEQHDRLAGGEFDADAQDFQCLHRDLPSQAALSTLHAATAERGKQRAVSRR